MKKILITGALSAIAQATARCFACEGASFVLVGRSEERLRQVCDDLKARGAEDSVFICMDLNECDNHQEMFKTAIDHLGQIDLLFVAQGFLGDQGESEQDFAKARQVIETNFTSVVSLLTEAANVMEARQAGNIAVISSVAGDRGRKSNYVYGSSKAGLNAFLTGLRARLYPSGVNVLNVKPGFVDTPMTSHIKKTALFATADKVGADIYRALLRKRDVLYTPWFWRWILLVVRLIPGAFFKRMNL